MPQAHSLSTRQPIRQLPPQLANQIAAGEVVERPASIVKELLENSLDAGATRITVVLKQGGLQSISVQDDGMGIPLEELPLALASHATSKISSIEDLTVISSMGFRGEALASIGSVSRLQMTSRYSDSDRAWMVNGQHGNEIDTPVPAAHPTGTTVIVQELFFNTPARRRFLRSERTEYRHCEEVVRRLALSRSDVAFTLKHNQRTVFSLPAVHDEAGQLQRLERLCGRAFRDAALYLDFHKPGLHLYGWLGLPLVARPQADLQYFYVNNRIIRDRVISHALRQAFADHIYPGRHPAYVLYLEVEPGEVDVNVHPTKHEVRFHQGRLVHDFLVTCVKEALSQEPGTQDVPYARQPLDWHQPATGHAPGTEVASVEAGQVADRVPDYSANQDWHDSMLGTVLGIIHGRFLLLEHPDGLVAIDLPHLQQDYLCREFKLGRDDIVSRPLLIPLSIEVSEPMANYTEHRADLFYQAGFDLGRTGKRSLILRQCPALLTGVPLEPLVISLLENLVDQQTISQDDFIETILQQVAVSPVPAWTLEQAGPLISFLQSLDHPISHPAVSLLEHHTLQGLFSRS